MKVAPGVTMNVDEPEDVLRARRDREKIYSKIDALIDEGAAEAKRAVEIERLREQALRFDRDEADALNRRDLERIALLAKAYEHRRRELLLRLTGLDDEIGALGLLMGGVRSLQAAIRARGGAPGDLERPIVVVEGASYLSLEAFRELALEGAAVRLLGNPTAH